MDRDKSYRLIQYAQATVKLSEKSDILPSRESHVRELLKLETDDQRAEVWQKVIATNDNPKAKDIADEVTAYKLENGRNSAQIPSRESHVRELLKLEATAQPPRHAMHPRRLQSHTMHRSRYRGVQEPRERHPPLRTGIRFFTTVSSSAVNEKPMNAHIQSGANFLLPALQGYDMTTKSKFHEPLAVAVAGGQSIRSAAEAVGCSRHTAYNLSATPEFRHRVAIIRSELTAEAVGILTQGATQAAATLIELLGEANDPKDRLAASKAILASLGPITEIGEIRQRLNAIEKLNTTPALKVAQ